MKIRGGYEVHSIVLGLSMVHSPSSSRYILSLVDTNSHNNDEMSGVKSQSGMIDSFCKKNGNSLTFQELNNIEKERRAILLRVSSCMYCSSQFFVHITCC